jgi:hypothetical protein
MNKLTGSIRIGLAIALVGLLAARAQAQQMTSGEEIIGALQQGGYVLVMRHGSASLDAARGGRGGGGGFGGGGGGGRGGPGGRQAPEPTEEALEQTAIQMLTGMRHAIWAFDIPIGAVYSSPARRTREHAEELPFAEIMLVDELDLAAADSGWLGDKLTEVPMTGTNTLIVTHSTNIANDLGLSEVAEGETLIVRPGRDPTVVGRLDLREWSVLAVELID